LPAAAGAPSEATPSAMRLQILSTEHWSLLATRSLAWNEAFSRAGMFLSTLAGAIVALALVAQATDFGEGFRQFALVILPIVLFVGVATTLRIADSNFHDILCVVGMNRIRAGYLELAPDLERYFVMGTTDDERGVFKTMALDPRRPRLVVLLASTPHMISTLNAVVLGAIASLLAIHLGMRDLPALGIGAGAFVVGWLLHAWYARTRIARARTTFEPLFPSA
jgi:hypothetical protein